MERERANQVLIIVRLIASLFLAGLRSRLGICGSITSAFRGSLSSAAETPLSSFNMYLHVALISPEDLAFFYLFLSTQPNRLDSKPHPQTQTPSFYFFFTYFMEIPMAQGIITTLRPNVLSDILLGEIQRVPSRKDGKIPHQLDQFKVLCGAECVN